MRIVVLGATSAIAQAAARIWAERGEELLLVGRDPQKLEAVAGCDSLIAAKPTAESGVATAAEA